ncbi:MAG: hypothetical protein QM757_39185 [Paludibaculum sp.]
MKRWILSAVLLAVVGDAAFAQDGGMLDVMSPQPLVGVSRELNEKYGWVINFEDAPVSSPKFAMTVMDGRGKPMVVARPSRISVRAKQFALLDDDGRRKLLQSAIDQANNAGAPVRYGYSMVGDIVRIFPQEILSDQDGTWRGFTPLLDTPVSIPQGRYRIGRVMQMVLAEVERRRGVQISIGTVSPNLSAKEVVEGATEESARLILDRAFDSVNRPRLKEGFERLVFSSELNYWTDTETFFYNMDVVKRVYPPTRNVDTAPTAPATGGRFFSK